MKILTVSDVEVSQLYSTSIRGKFGDVDLALSCGDLPYFYLEYIISMLDVPLYYVRGNHQNQVEYGIEGDRSAPWGGMDLHRRVVHLDGLLLAGVEGCLAYNYGPAQYSQADMWSHIYYLVPQLLLNRLRYGRYLDIFITHAPPWGIHDAPDRAHQGVKAFLWLDRVFKPAYHFHGHTHIYLPGTIAETWLGPTRVINTYGYRVTTVEPSLQRAGMEG